ncbi:ABC transporter substrate-binding protein [Leptospira sp. GIMC2001]|uniref:ABC transporter substrate-binding protein n=1 Tax=Leptospira sp. GIMC2001 TaxID=1513297 RepID=UPI00234BC1CC|nr:ABC transporter substrate-binding protein [Leptospira sp. GIMC2001]WCL50460.1 ABC transporter substrate-binding protein [Leptospira sp. GIMC2001]
MINQSVNKFLVYLFFISLVFSSPAMANDSDILPESKPTEVEANDSKDKEEVGKADEQVTKVVKKLIGFIRYKKNDKAIQLIHVPEFSNQLLKSSGKISASERKEFEAAISNFIINRSFPIALKYFDKIDINYEKPSFKGKTATLGSSIIYDGSEKVTFSWILKEIEGSWYVVDFLSEGKYASETNRIRSIEPSIKKNGIKKTIALVQREATK